MASTLKPCRSPSKAFTILIVEDNASDTEIILHAVESADLRPLEGELRLEVRATGEGALKAISELDIDLVLSDMILPGISGLDLVSRIQEIDRNLPVLIVTRLSSVEIAVEAVRRGAYDYVPKPINAIDLGMRLHRAIRLSEIVRRHSFVGSSTGTELLTGALVGVSEAFYDLMTRIREAAQARTTVLIMGETGTGKGLIACAIHEQSHEREKPYQVIDCTTVPEGMVESELFGHVRGAFTGAVSDKPGLFELANGGTALLDEIGELPLPMQAKLLRVLEENEVRPVGGTRAKRVDMRFIAATNQDLEERVKTGKFRADLYYRLAAMVVRVAPLRQRLEDIPVIARHHISRLSREMGKPMRYLDADAMAALTEYRWPGNVRELRNILERAILLSKEEHITGQNIKSLLASMINGNSHDGTPVYADETYMQAKSKVLAQFMRRYLNMKLSMHGGQINKAAEDAGIPRQHFSLLMKRYLERDS